MSVAALPNSNEYDLSPFPVYRFSVEEYRRLGEIGVLAEDDNVELLEGWIVPKMNHNPRHDAAVEMVDDALRSRLPAGWRVRIQSAITTIDSEPEPDLAVVHGPAQKRANQHPLPQDIELLVEVADTSLARDRFKCRLYARADVKCYWIINLAESQVEVYTEPSGQADVASYRCRVDYRLGDSVPLVIEGRETAQISVSELLL
jgi:hypothetical protein